MMSSTHDLSNRSESALAGAWHSSAREQREQLIERKLRHVRCWRQVSFGMWFVWIVIGVGELVVEETLFGLSTVALGLFGLLHEWYASRTYASPDRIRERYEEGLAAQVWRP